MINYDLLFRNTGRYRTLLPKWYEYNDGQGGIKFLLTRKTVEDQIKAAKALQAKKPARNRFDMARIISIPWDMWEPSKGPQTREQIMSAGFFRMEEQRAALAELEKEEPKAKTEQKATTAPEQPKTQEPPADYEAMTDAQLKAAAIAEGMKPDTADRKSRPALITHLSKGGSK